MGSGKSTVGRCLAEKLGFTFVDLDAEIIRREARPIADIFREQGEPHFRQLEHETLGRILAAMSGPTVIALGGGTFIQSRNRDLLSRHGARTVYLDGPLPVLLERCAAEQDARPLARDSESFRALHAERQPIYRLAEVTVEIGDRTPEAIADALATALAKQNAQPAVPE